MKNEPSEFSIIDLKQVTKSCWNGIRNYQVRNMLRDEMKNGDLAFFYHSNAGKGTGIAGLMEICKSAYPDETQFDQNSKYFDPTSDKANPRWLSVDVKFKKAFSRPALLPELREMKVLQTSPLLRKGNRLSVIKLTKKEFDAISKRVT